MAAAPPVDRGPGETRRAAQAWADYLALGPNRSLEKLATQYADRRRSDGRVTAPTLRLRTLQTWSAAYGWQARLAAIAEREARAAEQRDAAYRRSIMEAGYALAHERVKALGELALTLRDELRDPRRRWLRDVKQIGSGESAERVDVERFNAAEVEQFRGLLDDIARELGQRVKRTQAEISGKDGGPIEQRLDAHLAHAGSITVRALDYRETIRPLRPLVGLDVEPDAPVAPDAPPVADG